MTISPATLALIQTAKEAARPGHHSNKLLHMMLHFGVFGLFFISIVDSSFVPLPIPGLTDIMIVLLAAQKTNWLLLVVLATAGSAVGGFFSYQVGHAGGMAFLQKHVPARIFNRVCGWMQHHAILAVALPALLPPPMPLSPFVLAAGALNMSRTTFMWTFTISRAIRHAIAAFLGIYYGRHILRIWNAFSQKWATTILVAVWSIILVGCAIAFWKLYQTSRSVGSHAAEPEAS
ncbi:membrane protein YqaA with SNARE-associated domain [Granulicella aggregans]|uniref:Membrane protein YqaA with SNARE-associated domain n=1 Tax=Granulicella aggregans TaxID=474949 RepID=A0A7W8E3T7_9BACT|nr:VTT domain-containing protein [Granulicella aggregans]MBB5057574.1 membrane protein YqaA with SNARE-associated domain [Granulicella aggregans]